MKYSEIKEVINAVSEFTDEWRSIVEHMVYGPRDFEVDGLRFIHRKRIMRVLEEELESDPYILGCFNASFIAGVTDWPIELVDAAQLGEQYGAIGVAIISRGLIHDFADSYSRLDGYGPHFAGYDGEEREVGDYYFFRT